MVCVVLFCCSLTNEINGYPIVNLLPLSS